MTSEVVAGLTGGLLALAGALVVQWLAGRQSRHDRRIQLIANFLADAGQLVFDSVRTRVAIVSDNTDQSDVNDALQIAINTFDRAKRSGQELAFLCPKPTAEEIAVLLTKLETMLLDAFPGTTSDEEFDAMENDASATIDALRLSLLDQFGA